VIPANALAVAGDLCLAVSACGAVALFDQRRHDLARWAVAVLGRPGKPDAGPQQRWPVDRSCWLCHGDGVSHTPSRQRVSLWQAFFIVSGVSGVIVAVVMAVLRFSLPLWTQAALLAVLGLVLLVDGLGREASK
jgi:Flp pilus assembly protein TadB